MTPSGVSEEIEREREREREIEIERERDLFVDNDKQRNVSFGKN